MREGFDREIDSLLRRRARGTAESRPWGDGAGDGSQGAHLDADELGAFAEGALPAAARVAAASHLADCERCRGVAVGLARVAGAGAEVKQQAVAATAAAESERTPAWRALLASLFSPRAMRFAVPVLALSLVGVVSYVALRSNRGASEMTRGARPQQGTLENTASAPAASNTGAADPNAELISSQNVNAAPHDAPAPVGQPGETRGHGGADRPEEVAPVTKDEQPSEAAAPPPPPPASAATEGPTDLSRAAPAPAPKQAAIEEGEAARSDSRESAERKEKSARAPEPADDVALSNNDAVQRNRAAQTRMNETQVQMPDGGTRNQKRGADNNASGGYNVGGSAAATPKESERDRAGARSAATGRAASRRAEKKADDYEDAPARGGDTRTAAGHRFRRKGNAWVDVNYKDSMPSTGVRRGTDAFRALVADVPEIGRIAEQLSGEVITVVRGRAYRIR